MSKQRSLTPRISFTTLKDLPIAGKLLLLALVPLGITLAATLILIIMGLNRLEAATGTAQLQEEVRIIGQQFSQFEANLKIITERLANDPSLLAAVQQGDKATLQEILLSNSIHSALDHLQVVDGDGQTLNVTQSFVLDNTSAELERLHKLGLLEIETTELVPTTTGWLLTILQPLKTETGLVGALSVGRLLDTSTLSKLNFERTNPQLVLLDAQGKISVSSETNDQGNLQDAFEVNVNFWDQAKQGQVLLDQANIGGEVGRVAYGPLVVGNKTATVFGVLLSTRTTTNLRDQLVTTTLIVVGVLTVLGALSALGLGRKFIVRPITALVAGAEQIRAGQLELVALDVTNHDELGMLASAFNSMTSQLQQMLSSLENRSRRLEIIATLGENLSGFLNVEELLTKMVNQIKDNFGYYHTHVYLLDDNGKNLVVAEGTGEAGAEMKAKGHSIRLDAPTSLVARAARSAEIVRVDNVRETEDWLPNPLLPHTASEMAVPIILEGRVVGILDVQEDKVVGLDENDANLLRSLVNQVAVTMRNARLFAEVETALAEAYAAQVRYVEQSWEKTKIVTRHGEYHYTQPGVLALSETKAQALAEAKLVVFRQNRLTTVNINGDDSHVTAVVSPIMLRDISIGALQVCPANDDQLWTEDDLAVIEAVAEELAQMAENLRLFEEARERAGREQIIREITEKMRATTSLQELVKITARELGQRLSAGHAVLEMGLDLSPRKGEN